ncbi:outer membrane protein assembly factor BamB family protein [Wenyingzhuangia sp. IMCC45574]
MNKTTYLFLIVLIVQSSFCQKKYDFETDQQQWKKSAENAWNFSTDKKFAGTTSLKYTLPNTAKEIGAIYSLEVGQTVHKVRTAKYNGTDVIVASTYEGTMMALDFNGVILWKNTLSGFMVHDIWCVDITGNGNDEVLVANADGTIYCLDVDGKELWSYQKNEVPMYAVTAVKKEGQYYVVAGSLDLNCYYLSSTGSLVKELKSADYSNEKTWGTTTAKDFVHYANFLRPLPKDADNDYLIMHASNNPSQDRGAVYMFDVLEDNFIKRVETEATSPIGELRFSDYDKDGTYEVLMGASNHQNSANVSRLNLKDDTTDQYKIDRLGFGYSVVQPELILDGTTEKYFFLVGNFIVLVSKDFSSEEKLSTKYSYYDMWKRPNSNQIVLASCQSGGSQIHILDTGHADWKQEYQDLIPGGKIQKILANTAKSRLGLASYTKPALQRDARDIYFMTESTDNGVAKTTADNIRVNYDTPVFLGGSHFSKTENWDRSSMPNEKYKNRRDSRKKYELTQQQSIDMINAWYDESPKGDAGIAYWGGHGNDPYFFQLDTRKQTLDYANGKKTIMIFPELEDHSDDFTWVMDDLFYPLADYGRTKNLNIYVRTKHNFWQANVYLPMWSGLLSGEYSDIFVPSMEETTDKAMDISIASRVGIWASGAVDNWGTRTVPDNPSYDRSRQFCHQRLPNHFLRHLIYHMANGATHINNFPIDPDYMSIVWDLVAKGALFVPEPNELVSLSPVHLSMLPPEEHYLVEGSSLKWATHYDEDFLTNNSFVFSRQNANWMGAKNTPWDFSTYAGQVKDRRQNYLPSYPNGLVLITPPQEGANADTSAPRGALKDKLHPLYKDILKEYYTDGRYYYSKDGTQTFSADQYYKTIEEDIKLGAKKIPLTVSGNVAWVVAQTSPTNLRLTLIDGAYLNPGDRKAVVTFQTVSAVGVTDILDGKSYTPSGKVTIDVPCGGFRFIDITLSSPLNN